MSDGTIDVVEDHRPEAVRRILESLPDWFGDPTGIDHYVRSAADPSIISLLAMHHTAVIGVALLRRPFPETAELHLIAVTPEHRRTGTGTALLDRITSKAEADGCSFLTVHTVGPSFDSPHCAQTRAFYLAAGFLPLAEHTGIDWWGPTLILVRPLRRDHDRSAAHSPARESEVGVGEA